MTFREKVAKEHPECLDKHSKGGVMGCPCSNEYKYEKDYWCGDGCGHHDYDGKCTECWDREMPTTPIQNATKSIIAMGTASKEYVSSYEQGLQDAWELATNYEKMSMAERKRIFGVDTIWEILNIFTPQEALAKLKGYEEVRVKVGDVVETEDCKGVVIDQYADDRFYIFTENGCVEDWCYAEFAKTGKYIDIESLLEQIRGAEG